MYRMAGERVRWPVIVDRAREIVEGYEGGVTLRQAMYRLVSEGVLPHTPSMYRRLQSRQAQVRRERRWQSGAGTAPQGRFVAEAGPDLDVQAGRGALGKVEDVGGH